LEKVELAEKEMDELQPRRQAANQAEFLLSFSTLNVNFLPI